MKDKDLNALDLGSRTAKVAGALFVGKLFSFVVLAITFIAVVRILAPANYGIYTLVVAFVGIFSSVGNFGVATITNKLLAENNKNKAGKIIDIRNELLLENDQEKIYIPWESIQYFEFTERSLL